MSSLRLYEIADVYLHDLEMLEYMETSGELTGQVLTDMLEMDAGG